YAVMQGQVDAVRELLEHKASVDAPLTAEKQTALQLAVAAGNSVMARMLLDHKANPNAVDSSGRSALHYAAYFGRQDMAGMLLQAGANTAQTDSWELTPNQLAQRSGKPPIVQENAAPAMPMGVPGWGQQAPTATP